MPRPAGTESGRAHPKSQDKGQDKHIIHCPVQKRKDFKKMKTKKGFYKK